MHLDAPWDEYVDLTPGTGLALLAGYVVEDTLLHSGIVPGDPHGVALRAADAVAAGEGIPVGAPAARRAGQRAVVRATYDRLAGKGLAYRREALDELGDQVVRPWGRVQREGGTCLDLAVVACGQLLACDLRPLLVVGYGDGLNHAVVLVDLETPPTQVEGTPWPSGVRALPGETVVPWPPGRGPGPGWLVYDPTLACVPAAPFDDAEDAALRRLGDDVWLVDVLPARRATGRRRPPPPTSPGLLSHRCPPPPAWLPLDSREELVQELTRTAGTTVLVGGRGAGKSVVALEAVQRAHSSAGWFLSGSSRQALLSSLAEQEAAERSLAPSQVALAVEGYARAALGRLHAIDGPWRVVVDNADLPVQDIEDLLPLPVAGAGQHLIVTTAGTRSGDDGGWSAWAKGDERRCRPVGPLSQAEADEYLADSGGGRLDLLDGDDGLGGWPRSPLLLRTLGALARRGVAVRRMPGTTAQQAYWRAVREEALLDDDDLRLARAVALLPPVPVPTAALAEVAPPVLDRLQHLRQLGLLTRSRDDWSMHGTLAEVVRDDVDATEAAALAVLLLGHPWLRSLLGSAYDSSTVERLRSALEGAPPDDAGAVRALAELVVIVDQRGTAAASAAIARTGLARTSSSDGDLRALFLLGVARWVNQHPDTAALATGRPVRDEVDLALSRAREAEAVASSPDLLTTAVAMQGLLTKRRAQFLPVDADDMRVGILRDAERLVRQALEMRSGPDVDPVMLAKAQYNVCGISLELAKAEPVGAPEHLDAAADAYRTVGALRRSLYGTAAHRHVASCTAGEGKVDYYAALLLDDDGDGPPRTRTAQLRRATGRLVDSLAERELLEPVLDAEDVRKSLELLAKTVLLRLAVERGSLDAVLGEQGVVAAFRDEALRWAPSLASPAQEELPGGGHGTAQPAR